jgi:hypothetical protein
VSVDFPRTRRSLDSDRSLPSRLGAAVAMLALAGFGYAFFSERPVLVIADESRLERHDSGVRVVARFEREEARARIRPGQSARVTLPGGTTREAGVVAVLANGEVELALDSRVAPEGSFVPRVEVEVERISTALRVLRAAGAR